MPFYIEQDYDCVKKEKCLYSSSDIHTMNIIARIKTSLIRVLSKGRKLYISDIWGLVYDIDDPEKSKTIPIENSILYIEEKDNSIIYNLLIEKLKTDVFDENKSIISFSSKFCFSFDNKNYNKLKESYYSIKVSNVNKLDIYVFCNRVMEIRLIDISIPLNQYEQFRKTNIYYAKPTIIYYNLKFEYESNRCTLKISDNKKKSIVYYNKYTEDRCDKLISYMEIIEGLYDMKNVDNSTCLNEPSILITPSTIYQQSDIIHNNLSCNLIETLMKTSLQLNEYKNDIVKIYKAILSSSLDDIDKFYIVMDNVDYINDIARTYSFFNYMFNLKKKKLDTYLYNIIEFMNTFIMKTSNESTYSKDEYITLYYLEPYKNKMFDTESSDVLRFDRKYMIDIFYTYESLVNKLESDYHNLLQDRYHINEIKICTKNIHAIYIDKFVGSPLNLYNGMVITTKNIYNLIYDDDMDSKLVGGLLYDIVINDLRTILGRDYRIVSSSNWNKEFHLKPESSIEQKGDMNIDEERIKQLEDDLQRNDKTGDSMSIDQIILKTETIQSYKIMNFNKDDNGYIFRVYKYACVEKLSHNEDIRHFIAIAYSFMKMNYINIILCIIIFLLFVDGFPTFLFPLSIFNNLIKFFVSLKFYYGSSVSITSLLSTLIINYLKTLISSLATNKIVIYMSNWFYLIIISSSFLKLSGLLHAINVIPHSYIVHNGKIIYKLMSKILNLDWEEMYAIKKIYNCTKFNENIIYEDISQTTNDFKTKYAHLTILLNKAKYSFLFEKIFDDKIILKYLPSYKFFINRYTETNQNGNLEKNLERTFKNVNINGKKLIKTNDFTDDSIVISNTTFYGIISGFYENSESFGRIYIGQRIMNTNYEFGKAKLFLRTNTLMDVTLDNKGSEVVLFDSNDENIDLENNRLVIFPKAYIVFNKNVSSGSIMYMDTEIVEYKNNTIKKQSTNIKKILSKIFMRKQNDEKEILKDTNYVGTIIGAFDDVHISGTNLSIYDVGDETWDIFDNDLESIREYIRHKIEIFPNEMKDKNFQTFINKINNTHHIKMIHKIFSKMKEETIKPYVEIICDNIEFRELLVDEFVNEYLKDKIFINVISDLINYANKQKTHFDKLKDVYKWMTSKTPESLTI